MDYVEAVQALKQGKSIQERRGHYCIQIENVSGKPKAVHKWLSDGRVSVYDSLIGIDLDGEYILFEEEKKGESKIRKLVNAVLG